MSGRDEVKASLWEAAFDFRRVVVPMLYEWLPRGDYIPVEGGDDPALAVIDQVAGIDGWFVSGSAKLQGIAHRVQYADEPWESFTIRARLPSGGPTELEKRLEALRNAEEHFVVPMYTVQAYVEKKRVGRLLMALMVKTHDLFEFIIENPELVQRRINPEDGTEFLVVWAQDLVKAGYEVRIWIDDGVTVRLKDGHAYYPSKEELREMEEEEAARYAGRSRLARAALTMAVKQWKVLMEARDAAESPVEVEVVVGEITHLADGIIRTFSEQGITEMPEAECDYCDPYAADLFPNDICPSCGRLPEERI